nr:hypothetical protein [uncultured Arsenicibacter sp.]
MESFFLWMFDYAGWFIVLSVSSALIRRKSLTGYLRFIFLPLSVSAIAEVTGHILSRMHIPNLFVLHIYTIFEFSALALFYRAFFGTFYPSRLVPCMMLFFTLASVANSIWLQPPDTFNGYARALEGLFVMILALMCYYKILVDLDTRNLFRNPVFWINTGYLFYFAGTLFLFILSNLLLQESERLNFISWGMHATLVSLNHVLIAVGIWQAPQRH